MAISSRAIIGDWNGNVFIDSLLYGAWKWQSVWGPTAPTVVGVYFSDEGLAWATSEEWVFASALSKWSAVADISFDFVSDPDDANLVEIKRAELVGVSGSHHTPMQAGRSRSGCDRGIRLVRVELHLAERRRARVLQLRARDRACARACASP
jgi:hypothetical protein